MFVGHGVLQAMLGAAPGAGVAAVTPSRSSPSEEEPLGYHPAAKNPRAPPQALTQADSGVPQRKRCKRGGFEGGFLLSSSTITLNEAPLSFRSGNAAPCLFKAAAARLLHSTLLEPFRSC